MLPQKPTEREFFEWRKSQLVPSPMMIARLTPEQKRQYNWLHNAEFTVLWLQSATVRETTWLTVNDITSVYRKPLLRNHRDYQDLLSIIKRLEYFYRYKDDNTVTFIDTNLDGKTTDKAYAAYRAGKFRTVDLFDLD